MAVLEKMRESNYFKTVVAILLIVAIVLGFFFGVQFGLHTSSPMMTVESGSMSIPFDRIESKNWQGFWLSLIHPFDRTLGVGDIIIVQGVNVKDLNTNYPKSDIIVFHRPGDPITLVVHRIISVERINGTLYFATKGDGNGNNNPWPETPTSGFDQWDPQLGGQGAPASEVVGRVVMRILWFGWITLEMKNPLALPIVIAIILLLVVIEFVIPIVREKKHTTK